MLIMNFVILVLIPGISIAMMSGLNFISSIKMPKREDRIGPLIIILTLYIWYFVNVNGNAAFPDSLRFVGLGLCLSLGLAFFINNFVKISLHAIGIAGFTTALWLLLTYLQKPYIDMDLGILGVYRVSAIFTLVGSVLLCGLVGTSRLYLKAHRPQEVYGGYLIGYVAQIIAFRIIM